MENHLINYLEQFRSIPATDQQLITAAFREVSYKSGDQISTSGQVINHLYFINKGILKITVPGEDNKEVTYFFLKEHQMMTFLYSLYGNVPAEQGLRAACDLELLEIDKASLNSLFEHLPYFRSLIDQIAHLSMVEMINIRNTYIVGDSLKRYQLFLQLQPNIALSVQQTDIASYLGITPQSLSRIRKKIK